MERMDFPPEQVDTGKPGGKGPHDTETGSDWTADPRAVGIGREAGGRDRGPEFLLGGREGRRGIGARDYPDLIGAHQRNIEFRMLGQETQAGGSSEFLVSERVLVS